MNKKGEVNKVGMFFVLFIGVLVGALFISEIATQQGVVTSKSTITNESQDIASARNASHVVITTVEFNIAEDNEDGGDTESWKQTKCPITNFVLRNQSNYTAVDDTDYVFTESIGNFTLLDTFTFNSTARNTTYATYTHCRDGYNTESGERGVANLWTLFAAFALLGFAAYYLRDALGDLLNR